MSGAWRTWVKAGSRSLIDRVVHKWSASRPVSHGYHDLGSGASCSWRLGWGRAESWRADDTVGFQSESWSTGVT